MHFFFNLHVVVKPDSNPVPIAPFVCTLTARPICNMVCIALKQNNLLLQIHSNKAHLGLTAL